MPGATNTILIAEDEPLSMALLQHCLRGRDYQLVMTANGEEAVAELQAGRHEFSVIILDRDMPKMDGMQVLAFIKQDPNLKDTPVILQTALSDAQSITEGIAAGAFYYLTKPYQKEVLLSIVDAAVADFMRTRTLQRAIDLRQRGLLHLREGHFEFRTLDEAAELAVTLASVCPRPEATVSGLSELLVNAVEHGNLAITYDEKSELLKTGRWKEEVARRLAEPRYAARRVGVTFKRDAHAISITIRDEGSGFTPEPYLKLDPARATHSHGRGIAMAILRSFSRVTYLGAGNEVVAAIDLPPRT